jgi:L-fuculose-phosphate aldolase
MPMDDLQFKIAAARRMMFHAGLDRDDLSGQVTARDESDPSSFWTTGLELFDLTTPETVIRSTINLGHIRGSFAPDGRSVVDLGGPMAVSAAAGWLSAIYRHRPDVNAVIHTHAPHISAVATTGEVVGMYHNRTVVFYKDQAFYDDDGTRTASGEDIVDALGDNSVLIMRNHGAVVVAPSIEAATVMVIMLEQAARFHVLARSIGGTPFADNDVFLAKRDPMRKNPWGLWEQHLRRLRRTDPDLFEVTGHRTAAVS